LRVLRSLAIALDVVPYLNDELFLGPKICAVSASRTLCDNSTSWFPKLRLVKGCIPELGSSSFEAIASKL
jgi:hypothetical protein